MEVQYSLQELRARKKYTQSNMAERLNISRQRYIEIEKNPSKVSCERMLEIANILDVKIGDILLTDYRTIGEV